MLNVAGPIASVLVSRYGNRCVTISGAVITCIGFFCCTWSRDVQTMIILYGLVGGKHLIRVYYHISCESKICLFISFETEV